MEEIAGSLEELLEKVGEKKRKDRITSLQNMFDAWRRNAKVFIMTHEGKLQIEFIEFYPFTLFSSVMLCTCMYVSNALACTCTPIYLSDMQNEENLHEDVDIERLRAIAESGKNSQQFTSVICMFCYVKWLFFSEEVMSYPAIMEEDEEIDDDEEVVNAVFNLNYFIE
ncbi:MAG: hypothetical protein V2I33_18590 [Kangiellaceae bacterium]|jgi:hypothetical protein|nr:hypothetical protein [Kangiellaceae bacterium]